MSFRYLLSLCIICLLSPVLCRAQEGAPAQPPALVRTQTVVATTAASTSDLIGTLYFDRISRVSPEESARITQVTFNEGDRVKKGDILIRQDSRILEKELALKKARLAQAEIQVQKAKRNLDRQTHLFKKNIAPESSYDDQRFDHKDRIQETVALAREIDILTIRLAKHVVRAPFDGIILEKQAEVGEWVLPGSQLCMLAATDAIFIQVPVAEHLIRFSTSGDVMPVTLHASNATLEGIVTGIRPEADPKTKNISLKLKLNYEGPVAVNMSATVAVPVSEKRELVMIPRDALVQFQGMDMVFIVTDGKAKSLPVQVLYSRGANVGVNAQGLTPGMTVITEGNERLRPDQPVTVLPPAEKPSGGSEAAEKPAQGAQGE